MKLPYVPYDDLDGRPNIIADGAATTGTLLTLSHWPQTPTPREVRADTSAEMVLRYLERPDLHVAAEAVSNNHFDEDGLLGVFALTDPDAALARRERIVDVAQAGDFGIFAERSAARISFAISALADPETSPLDPALFDQPYPQLAASLYTELLPRVAGLLDDVDASRDLWLAEDAELARSEHAIDAGEVTIDEDSALDLAIVRIGGTGAEPHRVHRFTQPRSTRVHPMAVHNRTQMLRIATIGDGSYNVALRYETWVQLASRRALPRVDLDPLARRLDELEQNGGGGDGGAWAFDGVDAITPRLHLTGATRSTIDPAVFLAEVRSHLAAAPPAWDPYPA